MAALTLTELTHLQTHPGTYSGIGKATITAAGYTAFKIPEQARNPVIGSVTVNTAGEYKVEYSMSSDADFAAGTYRVIDIFGANQTTTQDFEMPPPVRAIIVTWVSGSITVEVSAK